MKRSRVLVVLHPSLMPPDTLEGQSARDIEEWRTEFDVIQTLRASGHEVRALAVLDSITELRTTIADWQPDVVFNLLEEFDGIVSYDQHVIAFLEMLRQPYTGCNPRGLLLSRDKALCKQVFAFSPHFHAAVRRVHARPARDHPAPAALPAVREIQHRRRLAGALRRRPWSRMRPACANA